MHVEDLIKLFLDQRHHATGHEQGGLCHRTFLQRMFCFPRRVVSFAGACFNASATLPKCGERGTTKP